MRKWKALQALLRRIYSQAPHEPIENWHLTQHRVRNAFDQSQIARVRHYQHAGFHRPPLIAGDTLNRFIVRGEQYRAGIGGRHFDVQPGERRADGVGIEEIGGGKQPVAATADPFQGQSGGFRLLQ